MKKSISAILDLSERIDVVDIRANPINSDPPYKKLLEANFANIFGFEPNKDAVCI